MSPIGRGIWAGIIATGPMTLSFFKFFQNPKIKEKPLPPSQITDGVEKKLALSPAINHEAHAHNTMASHFAYGAATGAIYAVLPKLSKHPLINGSLYGFAVWALSYNALIPSLGLKPRAPQMSKERNAMMIVSHLVWGTALAFAEEEMRKSGDRMLAKDSSQRK